MSEKQKMTMHPCGSIAIDMACRWGVIATIPDGEDSSGKSKLRLMTPVELAERAVACALALQQALAIHKLLEIEIVPQRASCNKLRTKKQ